MRSPRRLSSKLATIALVAAPAAFLVVQACSSDSGPGSVVETVEPEGGGSETSTPREDSGGEPGTDGSTKEDSGSDAGCADKVVNLDAGGQCGTVEFALPVAPFGPVDGGDAPYVGGTIPAGVYDVTIAERASGNGGFWHEVFVVDGKGRYTRTRQIATTNSDASVGPLTRRSGKYTLNAAAKTIKLEPDCATSDGTPVDAGSDELPYEVTGDLCKAPVYRFGATGFRLTFKRRD